jgi:ribulose-5-phosphate 4-epimerase/fuculose-1-phosphate aldolase
MNLLESVMTASDLVRVDMFGKVVEGGKPGRQTVTEAGAIVS